MYKSVIKPLLDLLFAWVLLVVTLPLVLICSVIVVLDSRGNPVFSQTRVGRGRRTFTMFKLRTMALGSDKGSFRTAEGDSRVTGVGRVLRKTSLDELPQIWNIAFGQMSFIGPRPDVPAQEQDYPGWFWEKRHQVKPGITGLHQALVRSSGTGVERLELDSKYVDKCSMALDIKILWWTALSVLGNRNVN